VATTLVTRRNDTSRWPAISPSASVVGVVPNQRGTRLAYEALRLGTSAAARSVDLWHSPHYTMPRRRVVPTVVTVHDLTFFTHPQWHERAKVTFFRHAISYATRHADVVICVSDFSARLLDEIVPDHVPVVVAPLGVELERFQPASYDDVAIFETHSLAWDVPYLFFVGTHEPRKGIDTLLDAFEQVARDDATVELWIAGQTGWGEDPMISHQWSDAARSRVRNLGFVNDELLAALMRHSRAVAYPSRGEGFGLPVLEAMACGAVVVTTRDTVMAEVAGDAAQLVSPNSPDELAAALFDALRVSSEDRERRAKNARDRASLFTWDRCISQHVLAYERALAGN
jgi:glycosyltransferase involved in cell wall biosynthesis